MLQHILNGLSAVGNVLDLPGSSVRDALAWKNPFDQYLDPMGDSNRTSGRDLLRAHGLAGKEDNWGNFAGGMAAEALLDPTNLFGGGMIRNALRTRNAVHEANAGIKAANTKSLSMRQAGAMPAEVAAQVALKTESGLPRRMYHGTTSVFDKFDPAKDSGINLYGKGFYHTSNPKVASSYTDKGQQLHYDDQSLGSLVSYSKLPSTPDIHRQSIGEVLGELPPPQYLNNWEVSEEAIALKRQLMEAGIPKDVVDGSIQKSPANVRMAYLDVRNPFDAIRKYPLSEIAASEHGQSLMDVLKANASEHREAVPYIIEHLRKKRSTGKSITTEDYRELSKEFSKRNPPSAVDGEEYLSHIKQAIGRSNLDQELQKMGHDGILHRGGMVIGDRPHKVAIAFSPDQVYHPYIAPALQAEKQLPSAKPLAALAAGLPAHNLLARVRHRRTEVAQ